MTKRELWTMAAGLALMFLMFWIYGEMVLVGNEAAAYSTSVRMQRTN